MTTIYDILDAVPDIGDKFARELTIARMAYEAGQKNATALQSTAQPVGELTDEQLVSCIKEAGYKTWDARMWQLMRTILAAAKSQPERQPLTEYQKMDLATNWFGEDWAIKKAVSLIEDTEAKHNIGVKP